MVARAGVVKSQRRVSQVLLASAVEAPTLSFMEDLFGEEFPEAFTDNKGVAFKSRKVITDLPAELLALVTEHLSKMDIKRLRLANKYMALNVEPKFERVYISPNRMNLTTLQQIIQHPRFKNQVREIVWDEAQLDNFATLDAYKEALQRDDNQTKRELERLFEHVLADHDETSLEHDRLELDDFFDGDRLTEAGKSVLLQFDDRFTRHVLVRDASKMSIEDSYAIYQKLYQDEQEIMMQQLDSAVLHEALYHLPGLRRITISSEVWRPWHLEPVYDTPFYRSLPPGFRKPSVYPWSGHHAHAPLLEPYDEAFIKRFGAESRGYSVIMTMIAALDNPRISEIMLDAANEHVGVSRLLFAAPNNDYDMTIRAAQRLPLTCLKLTLNSHYLGHRGDHKYLTNGRLKALFGELKHLVHLDFNPHCIGRDRAKDLEWPHTLISLEEVFPDELIRRLETFALRDTATGGKELFGMLSQMKSIKHITFDNVEITAPPSPTILPKQAWSHFFQAVKKAYTESNFAHGRPHYTFMTPFWYDSSAHFRRHVLETEIDAFLYADGPCPFQFTGRIDAFSGWIMDDRDPTFKVKPTEEFWVPIARQNHLSLWDVTH